jgi:hypothetical protein
MGGTGRRVNGGLVDNTEGLDRTHVGLQYEKEKDDSTVVISMHNMFIDSERRTYVAKHAYLRISGCTTPTWQ